MSGERTCVRKRCDRVAEHWGLRDTGRPTLCDEHWWDSMFGVVFGALAAGAAAAVVAVVR